MLYPKLIQALPIEVPITILVSTVSITIPATAMSGACYLKQDEMLFPFIQRQTFSLSIILLNLFWRWHRYKKCPYVCTLNLRNHNRHV